jgi:hypothetical protein
MKKRIAIVFAFLAGTYFLLQFVTTLKSDQAVLVDAITNTFSSEHLSIESHGHIELDIVDDSVIKNEIAKNFFFVENGMDYQLYFNKAKIKHSSELFIRLGGSTHYVLSYYDGESLFIGDEEKTINETALLLAKETSKALTRENILKQLSTIIPKAIKDEQIYQSDDYDSLGNINGEHIPVKDVGIQFEFAEANDVLPLLSEAFQINTKAFNEVFIIEKLSVNFSIDKTGFIRHISYFGELIDKKYGSRTSYITGSMTISENVLLKRPSSLSSKYQSLTHLIEGILSKEARFR